jgi:hypothetical protein
MNAYELADELKRCIDDGSTDLVCVCSAVNMLRQQADRIERKRELIREQTALLVKQNNRIAELETVLRSIANEPIELSHDKIKWQCQDHIRWAKEILK